MLALANLMIAAGHSLLNCQEQTSFKTQSKWMLTGCRATSEEAIILAERLSKLTIISTKLKESNF